MLRILQLILNKSYSKQLIVYVLLDKDNGTNLLCIFQLDVIVCDLDGGSIRVPEHLNIPLMPEPMYTRILHSLNKVGEPTLVAKATVT